MNVKIETTRTIVQVTDSGRFPIVREDITRRNVETGATVRTEAFYIMVSPGMSAIPGQYDNVDAAIAAANACFILCVSYSDAFKLQTALRESALYVVAEVGK